MDTNDKRWHEGYEAYIKAVKGEPVITILRVHLLTEYYLEQIMRVFLPRGDKLIESGNLSYKQKLTLVESFNITRDNLISSLKNLNRVRNACAHERERAITFHDVECIGRPFGKEYTQIKKERENTVESMLSPVLGNICAALDAEVAKLEDKLHT